MSSSRVILCLETPPVLHEQIVSSFVQRLTDLMHRLGDAELHIAYVESAAEAADHLVEALRPLGPVHTTAYTGPIVPILQNCMGEGNLAVLLPGVLPFLDVQQGMVMLDRHRRFATHYSYSDTAVPGFLFDVMSADIFSDMAAEGSQQQTIEALRAYCFRNIQDIDVDLHYAEPDLRAYHLRMDCVDARSADRALRLLSKYPDLTHDRLTEIVQSEPDVCGIQPSYVEIELTTEQAVRPTVYPSSPETSSLSDADAERILIGLKAFPLEADVTVCLGGRGDPFQYDGLDRFVGALSQIASVKALYVETPGVGLTEGRISSFIAAAQRLSTVLTLILRLPSLKPAQYKRWMGVDRLSDVTTLLDALCARPLPVNVCAEMIRLPDNEDELDGFMKRFAGPVRPLIGKYSRFGSALPALDVVDLSPLQRDYCRHLAFDLFINAKGCMPICRQMIDGGPSLADREMLDVFQSRRTLHQAFQKGDYDSISPHCSQCDDWYCFNA